MVILWSLWNGGRESAKVVVLRSVGKFLQIACAPGLLVGRNLRVPEARLRTCRVEGRAIAGAALGERQHDVREEAFERRRLVALADLDAAVRALDRLGRTACLQQAAGEPVLGALLFEPGAGALPERQGGARRIDHAGGLARVAIRLFLQSGGEVVGADRERAGRRRGVGQPGFGSLQGLRESVERRVEG